MDSEVQYYSVCLLPVILPALFWAGYHWYVDRCLPEPPALLLLAFLLGIASFYLGLLMYWGLGQLDQRQDAFALAKTDLPGLLFYCIAVIGVIEEGVKMLLFAAIVVRFRAFDEPIDGIIYASFIALGFAALENVWYLDSLTTGQAYARGFAAPVVHIVFASIWGYHIGLARLRRRPLLPVMAWTLAATAVLHGFYDFLAIGLPDVALPLVAALIVGLWIRRLFLLRDLLKPVSKVASTPGAKSLN